MAAQSKGGPGGRKRAFSAAPPPSFEACVVTYFSKDRAFQRVFAETDIEGMKNVVREKLGLSPETGIRLAQSVEGRRVDLEDDDDFYAFQLGTQMKPELQVEVSVIAPPAVQLASPSMTSASVNLEGTLGAQQHRDESLATTEPAALVLPLKEKKKLQKNGGPTAIFDTAGSVTLTKDRMKGKGKQMDSAGSPVPPKSQSEADIATNELIVSSLLRNEDASKKTKPKSASKSVPSTTQDTSSAPVPGPSVSAKPKKNKKGATIPVDSSALSAPTGTMSVPAPEPVVPAVTPMSTSTPVVEATPGATPSAGEETPTPRPKKRGRKSGLGTEPATIAPTESSGSLDSVPAAPSIEQPPVKKRRKAGKGETYTSVATTLPPPGPSQRKVPVAPIVDPDAAATNSIGSYNDIMRRWAARTEAGKQHSHAPGSEAGVASSTSSPTLPVKGLEIDTMGQGTEGQGKTKKKRKKTKGQTGQAPADTEVPNPAVQKSPCLVCQSAPHESLGCPLLSQFDTANVDHIGERIKDLQASQGPNRTHQILIGRLRTWLKAAKKQAEAHNISVSSSNPASTIHSGAKTGQKDPPLNPPDMRAQSPLALTRPAIPQKSKLSSVAVDHQSEGSSTDDENILKSVMRDHSDSEGGSIEEDDGQSDEEMADLHSQSEPSRESSLPSPPSIVTTPSTATVPLSLHSPPAKALLQNQRMSRDGVRALLDELEGEETANTDESDSDGSELAHSTPSDIVRRRHRKSVRLDVRDSDEESSDGGNAEVPQGPEDEDVNMQDASDLNVDLTTHVNQDEDGRSAIQDSQLPRSSQPPGEGADGNDDDIEEYESDEDAHKQAATSNDADSSPIESSSSEGQPDNAPSTEHSRLEANMSTTLDTIPSQSVDEAGQVDNDVIDDSAKLEAPPPKKRGRPPLPQAVKDARAAERARIQAEKLAQKGESSAPRKRGRPSLNKDAKLSQVTQGSEGAEVGKVQANTNDNEPGKMTERDGPSTQVPGSVPRSDSMSQAAGSQSKPTLSQDPTALASKPRGRPRLSDAVRAEREAEKERVRAEKAIKKLEKKTAKADAKNNKGKGADSALVPETTRKQGSESDASRIQEIQDSSLPEQIEVQEEDESVPTWNALKNPGTSSRHSSSQADEIEWSATDGEGGGKKTGKPFPRSQAFPVVKPVPISPDTNLREASGPAKPLFLPSSGVAPKSGSRFLLPLSSPSISTPVPTTQKPLSQQTPSNLSQRRKSITASSLPRFTDIQKQHNLAQRTRKEQSKLNSQPIKFNSSQGQSLNGASQDVVTIEDSSSSEGDSSGDETVNKPAARSRKKRSVFEYLAQVD